MKWATNWKLTKSAYSGPAIATRPWRTGSSASAGCPRPRRVTSLQRTRDPRGPAPVPDYTPRTQRDPRWRWPITVQADAGGGRNHRARIGADGDTPTQEVAVGDAHRSRLRIASRPAEARRPALEAIRHAARRKRFARQRIELRIIRQPQLHRIQVKRVGQLIDSGFERERRDVFPGRAHEAWRLHVGAHEVVFSAQVWHIVQAGGRLRSQRDEVMPTHGARSVSTSAWSPPGKAPHDWCGVGELAVAHDEVGESEALASRV